MDDILCIDKGGRLFLLSSRPPLLGDSIPGGGDAGIITANLSRN